MLKRLALTLVAATVIAVMPPIGTTAISSASAQPVADQLGGENTDNENTPYTEPDEEDFNPGSLDTTVDFGAGDDPATLYAEIYGVSDLEEEGKLKAEGYYFITIGDQSDPHLAVFAHLRRHTSGSQQGWSFEIYGANFAYDAAPNKMLNFVHGANGPGSASHNVQVSRNGEIRLDNHRRNGQCWVYDRKCEMRLSPTDESWDVFVGSFKTNGFGSVSEHAGGVDRIRTGPVRMVRIKPQVAAIRGKAKGKISALEVAHETQPNGAPLHLNLLAKQKEVSDPPIEEAVDFTVLLNGPNVVPGLSDARLHMPDGSVRALEFAPLDGWLYDAPDRISTKGIKATIELDPQNLSDAPDHAGNMVLEYAGFRVPIALNFHTENTPELPNFVSFELIGADHQPMPQIEEGKPFRIQAKFDGEHPQQWLHAQYQASGGQERVISFRLLRNVEDKSLFNTKNIYVIERVGVSSGVLRANTPNYDYERSLDLLESAFSGDWQIVHQQQHPATATGQGIGIVDRSQRPAITINIDADGSGSTRVFQLADLHVSESESDGNRYHSGRLLLRELRSRAGETTALTTQTGHSQPRYLSIERDKKELALAYGEHNHAFPINWRPDAEARNEKLVRLTLRHRYDSETMAGVWEERDGDRTIAYATQKWRNQALAQPGVTINEPLGEPTAEGEDASTNQVASASDDEEDESADGEEAEEDGTEIDAEEDLVTDEELAEDAKEDPINIEGLMVVDDQIGLRDDDNLAMMMYPFDKDGSQSGGLTSRYLAVWGTGLRGVDSLSFRSSDDNITYSLEKKVGDPQIAELQVKAERLYKREIPGGKEVVIIRAHLKKGIQAGTKYVDINETSLNWQLMFPRHGAIRFVRPGSSPKGIGETTFYPGEAIHVGVFLVPTKANDKTYKGPLEGLMADLIRIKQPGDNPEFLGHILLHETEEGGIALSNPIHLVDERDPSIAPPADPTATRIEVQHRSELRAKISGGGFIPLAPFALGAIKQYPEHYGSSPWNKALRTVAQCTNADPNVPKFAMKTSAVVRRDFMLPYRQSKEIWEGGANSNSFVLNGDHAALLLLRAELRTLAIEYQREVHKMAEDGMRGPSRFLVTASRNPNAKNQTFWKQEVLVPFGEHAQKRVPLHSILTLDSYRAATGRAGLKRTTYTDEVLPILKTKLRELAVAQKQVVHRMSQMGNCKVEEMLVAVGVHSNPALARLMPKLVKRQGNGWAPDMTARRFVKTVHLAGREIRAFNEFEQLDRAYQTLAMAAAVALTAGGGAWGLTRFAKTSAETANLVANAILIAGDGADLAMNAAKAIKDYQDGEMNYEAALALEPFMDSKDAQALASTRQSAALTALSLIAPGVSTGVGLRHMKNIKFVQNGKNLARALADDTTLDSLTEVQRLELAAAKADIDARATAGSLSAQDELAKTKIDSLINRSEKVAKQIDPPVPGAPARPANIDETVPPPARPVETLPPPARPIETVPPPAGTERLTPAELASSQGLRPQKKMATTVSEQRSRLADAVKHSEQTALERSFSEGLIQSERTIDEVVPMAIIGGNLKLHNLVREGVMDEDQIRWLLHAHLTKNAGPSMTEADKLRYIDELMKPPRPPVAVETIAPPRPLDTVPPPGTVDTLPPPGGVDTVPPPGAANDAYAPTQRLTAEASRPVTNRPAQRYSREELMRRLEEDGGTKMLPDPDLPPPGRPGDMPSTQRLNDAANDNLPATQRLPDSDNAIPPTRPLPEANNHNLPATQRLPDSASDNLPATQRLPEADNTARLPAPEMPPPATARLPQPEMPPPATTRLPQPEMPPPATARLPQPDLPPVAVEVVESVALRDGRKLELGKEIGEGKYAKVQEIASGPHANRVIKRIRVEDDFEDLASNLDVARDTRSGAKLLEENGIPHLPVREYGTEADGFPYYIQDKIPSNAVSFKKSQATNMSDGQQLALAKLYRQLADKGLVWTDGHIENVFFTPAAGRGTDAWTASILDPDLIMRAADAKSTRLTEEFEMVAAFQKGIGSVSPTIDLERWNDAHFFMAKMFEFGGRYIKYNQTTKQFEPVLMDPDIIRRVFPELDQMAQ